MGQSGGLHGRLARRGEACTEHVCLFVELWVPRMLTPPCSSSAIPLPPLPPPFRPQMKDIMMTRKARKMYQGLQKSRAAKQARVAALEQRAAALKK